MKLASSPMRSNRIKAICVAIIIVFILSLVPLGKTQVETQDYIASFLLLNRPEGDVTYELNVTIPQALYRYYLMQNHALYSDSDFAKFVTPYTLKPIADQTMADLQQHRRLHKRRFNACTPDNLPRSYIWQVSC